jgi:addiction module RelB/DinJ family antitoxin
MLQMRVTPEVKLASEHVLRRIGLNLTEATELFLHRMIIDQRIPFEVVAFDTATYTRLMADWKDAERTASIGENRRAPRQSKERRPAKRE